jgi:hypothetical protein
MHRILLVCFVCLLLALLTEGVAACRQPLAAAQGAQYRATFYQWANPTASPNFHNGFDFGVPLNEAQIAVVRAWRDRVWAWALDAVRTYDIVIETGQGRRYYLIAVSPTQPIYAYVFAFTPESLVPGGVPYGAHPNAVYRVPLDDVRALANGSSH